MRQRFKVVLAVVVLVVGAPRARGQEAGDSVVKRAIHWFGTPRSARAHNNQGVVWDKKGEFDKAIAEFTEAIRTDPSNTRAYYNRGGAWASKGDFDKAIADYTAAIRLDPKDAWPHGDWACVLRAYTDRAWVWTEKHEYNKAIADLDQAIQLDPKNARAYRNRGYTWDEMEKYDKAVADYTEAIRLDPRDPAAYTHRAWLWATCPDPRHRDGRAAVTSATRACELTGWKESFHLGTLAAAYAEAGDFDAAVKCQEKALELTRDEKDRAEGRGFLADYQAKKPYHEARSVK